jgi:hypothetical protein
MAKSLIFMAGTTRLELATSGVTGRRSNQLNYVPNYNIFYNTFITRDLPAETCGTF